MLLLLTTIYTGQIPQYIQNYIQYIHCCPGDPVKLKIEIILRNEKDKNSYAAKNKEISKCKKNFGDLEITNVSQRPSLGIVFTSRYAIRN